LTAMLEVDGIHTAYGSSRVLFGISLDIKQGECVCLLGRNGVGKTTTMRSIMGLTPPSQGSVRFKGKDVTGQSPYRLARHGIGYVPEDRRIFAELTVWENLDVAARSANRAGRWTVDTVVQLFPKLGELRDRMGGVLSGGEQQMLTIARTLMGNPRAVLLDEPSEGLAPVIVELMARAILAMKAEGIAVLLCEQNLAFASAVSDRAYVIERGQIRFEGTLEALAKDDAMREAYLGV
jgi:branched-chain amino acid transport system ATP-binding protein